jgi:hypothetical protein
LFAYSSFHFGLLGGFSGSIFLFCFFGFWGRVGGGVGGVGYVFFSLTNDSVLFAVLFFLKKVLFLIVVCKDRNYSQKHFPKAPQIASPRKKEKRRKK